MPGKLRGERKIFIYLNKNDRKRARIQHFAYYEFCKMTLGKF